MTQNFQMLVELFWGRILGRGCDNVFGRVWRVGGLS